MRRFHEPRHIPSREVPVLELVGVHTAAIKPQLAHKLIKLLGEKAPLEGLQHLKRVAKRSQLKALQGVDGPSPLQIVLCPVYVTPSTESDESPDVLPPAVLEIVTEHGLNPEVLQVSRFSPTTREELDEWGAFWPITWRPPDPHVPAVPPPDSASASRSAMELHMSTCLDMLCSCSAQDSLAAGTPIHPGCHGGQCCRNAAVIVDPSMGTVVGTGRDGTRHHPLLHAVMAAIESAAARDRLLWPNPPGACAPETAAASSSPPSSSSTKRQRTSEGPCHVGTTHGTPGGDAAATAPASSSSSTAVPGAAADVALTEAAQAAPGRTPTADLSTAKPYLSTAKPYLCTGFHCYVATEPCAMCAMALVHSRVARVIYCRQDCLQGALGGAFKLHQQRSLNHHYEAYHIPLLLPEDGKDSGGGGR